jgi:hypothetical protein
MTIRDEKYKKFIREHFCEHCGSWLQVESAHQNLGIPCDAIGMGMKNHDIFTLPECHGCHIGLEHQGKMKIKNKKQRVLKYILEYKPEIIDDILCHIVDNWREWR